MIETLGGSLLLALAAGIAYAAAGVAIRIQWALLGGFDLIVAVMILCGAEIQIYVSLILPTTPLGLLLATASSLFICAFGGATWNFLLASFFPTRRLGGQLLIASLGFSLAASGFVGWTRGAGLRQIAVPETVRLNSVLSPLSVSFAIAAGAPLLAAIWAWTRSRSGLATDLLSQDSAFAREIGITRRRAAVPAGFAAGLLGGVAGCYFSFASGSHPEIGLSGFLLGAGAAFFSGRRSLTAAIPGGLFVGSLQVGLQHALSPVVASGVLFLVIFALLFWRGADRASLGLR